MGKHFLNLGALLCLIWGMVLIGCDSKDEGASKEDVSQEPEAKTFYGDLAYMEQVCNDVNGQMMISSLKIGNEQKDIFDGMWIEDSSVVISIKSGVPLDYVTKGILALVLPKSNKSVLKDLLKRLNERKFVLPKNFFLAVKQNNYKIKFRYWDEPGEKLDIPLAYEDLPEPYVKKPNPLAQTIDGFETVTIGKQVWMAENLDIEIDSSVCYNHNPENCEQFGRLYDYRSAIKACPEGWHLPDSTEFEKLFVTAGKILSKERRKNNELDSIVKSDYTMLQGSYDNEECVSRTVPRAKSKSRTRGRRHGSRQKSCSPGNRLEPREVPKLGYILLSSEKTDGNPYQKVGLNYLGFNMKLAGNADYSYSSSGKTESISNERFNALESEACLWTNHFFENESAFWNQHLYLDFTNRRYERSAFYKKCSVRCVQNPKEVKE